MRGEAERQAETERTMDEEVRRLLGLILGVVLLATGQGCGSSALDGEMGGELGDPNGELPNPEPEPEPEPDTESEPDTEPEPEPADDELAPVTDLQPELLMLGGTGAQYIWGTAEDDLFLATRTGVLAHFDGKRWLPFDLGPEFADEVFLSLFGSSSKDVHASTNHYLWHFDGERWTRSDAPNDAIAHSIWGSAPDDVYAVSGSRVLHYDGSEWTPVETKLPPGGSWRGVSGSGPNDVVIVGRVGSPSSGRFAHFDGFKWREIDVPPNTPLRSVWSAGSGAAFAVGRQGKILFFDGKTLEPMESGTDTPLQAVWGRSLGEVYAAGAGEFLRFDGSTWSAMEAPASPHPDEVRDIQTIIGFDDGGLVAAGDGVDRFEDGPWEPLLPHSEFIEKTRASGQDDVLFTGEIVYRYAGQRVEPEDFGTIELLDINSAWGAEDFTYAAGYGGEIFRYGDGYWGRMTSNTSETIRDIFGTSEDDVFAVGHDGTIMHFDGMVWGAHDSGTDEDLRGVWAAGPDDVYAVGDNGALLHYDGEAWSAMDSGGSHDLGQVIGFDAEHVVALDPSAGVLHFGDGLTWRAEQAAVEESEEPFTRIEAIDGTDPNNMFGVDRNGLNHYDGERWTRVSSLGPGHYGSVLAAGPREVYTAGERGAYRFTVPSP
jgi:hypothetical protein